MASPAMLSNLQARPFSPRSQRNQADCDNLLSPPRFTSPGPLESEHEHAPYKPGPDDQISLDMHRNKTGWKGKRSQRLRYSDHSDEGQPLLESSNLAIEASRNTWYRRDNSIVDIGPEGFDCSLIRQDSVAQYRRRLTTRQQLSQVEEDTDSSESEYERRSSVDSLKFAKASSIHRKRGESLVGPTVQPVASLINAICVSSDSYISSEQSTLRTYSFGPTQRPRNQSWNDTSQSSHSKLQTLSRQDTPASITLRKASQVFHEPRESRSLSIANIMNWRDWFKESEPENSPPSNTRVKFELDTTHNTLPIRHERLPSVAVPQSAQSSLDLLHNDDDSAYAGRRRHSVTADLALTYAEMQPTHFARSGSLSRQALVAMGTNRKLSRSSVRIGSSVHEIIWAPDDSPNCLTSFNFDLTKSASLSPVTDRGSIGQGSLSVPTLSVEALRAISPTRKSATYPKGSSEEVRVGSVDEPSPHHGFSGWAWQPDTIREMLMRGKDQQSDSNSAIASDAQDSMQSKTQARIPSVSSGLDTVESFPPLLNRKKTSEWQQLPLVDLNDPLAGRETSAPAETRDDLSDVAKDKAPGLIISVLEAVAAQDFANDREPGLAEIVESPQKHSADLAVVKLSHSRQSLNSRHPRRASSNVGISKASRIRKPRRSISDGAVPNVAALLAQASRMVKNSMSTLPRDGEPHRRSSRASARRSRSVQSLSLEETPHPITTQDPSVRLVEVAGEDGGEGEDVSCFVTSSGNGRSKSRLSLNLDWMP